MEVTAYGLCPICEEPTDNGRSRELPPEAYVCSACACKGTLTAEVGVYTDGMGVNSAKDVTVITALNPDANAPIMIPSNWPAPDYDILEYVKRLWGPDHADLNQNEDDAQAWGYRLVHNKEELRKLGVTIQRMQDAYNGREVALTYAWAEYQGEKDV